MTPRLLDILSSRKYQNDRREAANAGLIAATLINIKRPKNKKAVKIEDIIGKDMLTKKETDFMEMEALLKKFAKKK